MQENTKVQENSTIKGTIQSLFLNVVHQKQRKVRNHLPGLGRGVSSAPIVRTAVFGTECIT